MADFSDLAEALEDLTSATDRLDQLDEVAAEMERLANAQRAAAEAERDELRPDRRYDYGAVADFLGMQRSSVRNIPKAELPRCGRGYVRGVDIMAFLGEITRGEAQAYKRHRRRRVTSRLPSSARAEA